MEYYYILGSLLILIILVLLAIIIHCKSKIRNLTNLNLTLQKKNNDLSEEFDSEKDFKYMHQIATFEMNNCADSEMLMITNQRPTELFKDKDLNNFVSTICKAAYEKFSDSYRNKLIIRYFGSEDKLIKYLTEYIYNVALKLFAKLNNIKIKKIKNSKKIEDVLKENEPVKKSADI